MRKSFNLLCVLLFILTLSSCCTAAIGLSTLDIIDRTKTKKTEEQLLDEYISAKSNFIVDCGNSWQGELEKNLIINQGAPSYSQEFENNEKILIYNSTSISQTTTGGNSTSSYNEFLNLTYTTKEKTVTTINESKGEVKVIVKKNKIQSVESKGIIKELDKIVKPTSAYMATEEYKTKNGDVLQKYANYSTRSMMNAALPYVWGGAFSEILCVIVFANMK